MISSNINRSTYLWVMRACALIVTALVSFLTSGCNTTDSSSALRGLLSDVLNSRSYTFNVRYQSGPDSWINQGDISEGGRTIKGNVVSHRNEDLIIDTDYSRIGTQETVTRISGPDGPSSFMSYVGPELLDVVAPNVLESTPYLDLLKISTPYGVTKQLLKDKRLLQNATASYSNKSRSSSYTATEISPLKPPRHSIVIQHAVFNQVMTHLTVTIGPSRKSFVIDNQIWFEGSTSLVVQSTIIRLANVSD